VADVDGVPKIEVGDDRGEVVGVVVHVMAIGYLR
jgi:hypothetical protein